MLKKIITFQILFFSVFTLYAQEWDKMKLGVEIGFPIAKASENLGLFINVEPKLKIAANTFIGLRFSMVLNPQKFENSDLLQFEIDDESDNGGISFVPTIDYYFKETFFTEKNIRPYVGLGVGAYLAASYVDVISNTSVDQFEVKVNKQIGFLFRGGFESNKLRFGLEYNYVQKADIEIPNGQVVGTVDNSYFGISIGFIIGSQMALN